MECCSVLDAASLGSSLSDFRVLLHAFAPCIELSGLLALWIARFCLFGRMSCLWISICGSAFFHCRFAVLFDWGASLRFSGTAASVLSTGASLCPCLRRLCVSLQLTLLSTLQPTGFFNQLALSFRPPFGFVFVFIALRILGSQFLGEIVFLAVDFSVSIIFR